MKKIAYSIAAFVLFMTSCIDNDIPYPYILGEIKEIAIEGQIGETKIDLAKRTVDLTVDERVELEEIKITKLIANQEALIKPDEKACVDAGKFPDFSYTSLNDLPANANTAMNFTEPVSMLLQTYQDYYWTIKVKQVIERSISVENQVGPPVIDEKNRIVLIYVSSKQPLKSIKINEMNLEGNNSRLVPDPFMVTNFTRPQRFEAYRNDKRIGQWTVDVVHTESSSSTGNAEVWARKAIVSGGMKSGAKPGVEFKKNSESNWKKVEDSAIALITSTTFKATIKGLEDGTAYQWRVIVDGVTGETSSFTTEKIQQVPNLNFDTWTLDGKNWFANAVANDYDDPSAYWATGNEGVTLSLAGGHDPVTMPVEGSDAYKGKAARLRSITGVNLVGAAAGNLLIGKYKTNLTNPSKSVEFGRPFTGARPSQLVGYFKYTPENITNKGSIPGNLTKDQAHIYIKLWDSAGNLFGYGEFVCKDKVSAYTKFTVDIDYKDLSARPSLMSIVATSSQYGGEFEGAKVAGQVGHGSTLWVDEFELIYD